MGNKDNQPSINGMPIKIIRKYVGLILAYPEKHKLDEYDVEAIENLLTHAEQCLWLNKEEARQEKAVILKVGHFDDDGWPRDWVLDCESRAAMLSIDPCKTDMNKISERIADLIDLDSTLLGGYTIKELREIAEAKVEGAPWRRITMRDNEKNELWSGLFEFRDGQICSKEDGEYHRLFESLKVAGRAGFTLVEVENL